MFKKMVFFPFSEKEWIPSRLCRFWIEVRRWLVHEENPWILYESADCGIFYCIAKHKSKIRTDRKITGTKRIRRGTPACEEVQLSNPSEIPFMDANTSIRYSGVG